MNWTTYWTNKDEIASLAEAEFLQAASDDQILDQTETMLASAVSSTRQAVDNLINDTNNKLFETRRRIDALGQLIQDVIVITDDAGTIDTISDACYALFGLTAIECKGFSIEKLFASDISEQHVMFFKGGIQYNYETTPTIETRMLRGDSSEFFAEFTVQKFEECGKDMFMGVIRDVTERIASQNAMYEANNRYKILLENVQDSVFVVTDGLFSYCNHSFAEMLGYHVPREIIGKEYQPNKLISDDTMAYYNAYIEQRRQGDSLVKAQRVSFINRHNETISATVSAQIITTENSEVLVATVKDKEAESRNKHMLQMLSTALNHIDDIVVLTDPHGKTVFVNKAFTNHYGYHFTDIIGQKPGEVIGTGYHDKEFFYHVFTDFLLKGKTWEGDIRNKNKAGNIFVDTIQISPILDEFGLPQFYLAITKK